MGRHVTGCALALVLLFTSVCRAEVPAAPEARTDEKALVTGDNAFALDLYGKLKEEGGNLFFSPFSISTALGMTYAGARGNTEAQMAKVLHFDLPQEKLHPAFKSLLDGLRARQKVGGYELSVANALWGQQGDSWLKAFLDVTRGNYGAGLQEVDFAGDTEAARQAINDWVEKETREKIKDLLLKGDVGRETALVLTNAIYFKGEWASQFRKYWTRPGPFTLSDGSKVEVPMMHQSGEFPYMETEDLQVLELPYVKGHLSMIVLLPRKVDGLGALEASLTADKLEGWLGELHKEEVSVILPKFQMTSRFELSEVLKALGMTDAFSLPPADFSGMGGSKDLDISKVIHKAFVDVNEEGTEAAAATHVVLAREGPPVRPVRADHPFLFLIRDNASGSILFMGRVTDPTGAAESSEPVPGTKAEEAPLPQDAEGNFVLYVSNVSYEINPVDMTVLIDGRKAVRSEFKASKADFIPREYRFSLAPGRHKLTVISQKGRAKLEEEFEVKDRHWAIIAYHYDSASEQKPRLAFWVEDKPIPIE